ncbi:MAG: hypothetical protein MUC59_12595 [Saprospiraceae bacterium]|nr:hypothetical protein [Saprospiraceae bacterium]
MKASILTIQSHEKEELIILRDRFRGIGDINFAALMLAITHISPPTTAANSALPQIFPRLRDAFSVTGNGSSKGNFDYTPKTNDSGTDFFQIVVCEKSTISATIPLWSR